MSRLAPFLALDTGSPVVSLAIGDARGALASRTIELRQSSERLLRQVGELLEETGWHLGDLRGAVVLQGPGSFTGLRVGLATVLGLHQALGLPATALPTLGVLARAAAEHVRDGDEVIAAVDALRGEWMARTFVFEGGEPQPVDAASLRPAEALVAAGRPIVGFGTGALGVENAIVPEALAPFALAPAERLAMKGELDPAPLVQPIYFRPPATTPSKRGVRPAAARA